MDNNKGYLEEAFRIVAGEDIQPLKEHVIALGSAVHELGAKVKRLQGMMKQIRMAETTQRIFRTKR